MSTDDAIALGYTLGSGKLYCRSFAEFHAFADTLIPGIMTHNFGDTEVWSHLRELYEEKRMNQLKEN